ncbi:MAG: type IV secretory system conjugative DNA transfer family protein [Rhizomicrobium sp.]
MASAPILIRQEKREVTPTKFLIGQIAIVFAVAIGGLWFATQWAAWQLGYQAQLGAPWFTVLAHPIYRPWSLFGWWYAYDAYAPALFNQAGAYAALSGFGGCAVAVVGSLYRARQNHQVTTYGSSRWATPREITTAGLLRPAGVFLGQFGADYLRHDGPEHVMAFAPTRSGKGVGLVVPTLLSWTQSVVIHDIKGENWQLTAGWRSRFSHCLLFNPTDPRSARYNPLLEVRKGPDEVRDVQNIADILVDPEGALERRNHWEKTSHSLLVGVILHVLYAEEEKTLARVVSFLSDPKRSFEHTLARDDGNKPSGHAEGAGCSSGRGVSGARSSQQIGNERSGVLSTAMSFWVSIAIRLLRARPQHVTGASRTWSMQRARYPSTW